MKSIQIHAYERRFAGAFSYGEKSLTKRRGIFIRYGDNYGEAAPLEGHSSDSLQEIVAALLGLGSEGVLRALEGERQSLPPALQFALECLTPAYKNSELDGRCLRVNALVSGENYQQIFSGLEKAAHSGFSVVKLKITEGNSSAVIEAIERSLKNKLPLQFRLDGNRSLSHSAWRDFVGSAERKSLIGAIEYAEEPCAELKSVLTGSPITLAADESAGSRAEILSLREAGVSVFILKPTALGGMKTSLELAGELHSKCVFSSLLESSIGRRHIAHSLMAANHSEPVGLGVAELFELDFFPSRPVYQGYQYFLPEENDWLKKLPWEGLQ